MDLAKMGAELFQQQAAEGKDTSEISGALQDLLGSSGQNVDLGGMVQKMLGQGDLQNTVKSWLGDGSNSPVSGEQIMALFDNQQIQQFADRLGIDLNAALSGLASALPQMVDKGSSGGSLDQSLAGGSEKMMDMAKRFLH